MRDPTVTVDRFQRLKTDTNNRRRLKTVLAFCFYNLSSIVNGLVYFDQISLLPASHLVLVTVGIIILLGGVWAVSLQAVDVGTWTSSDDVDVSLVEDGVAIDTSLPECEPTPPCPVPQTPEREHPRSHSETAASPPPRSPLSPRRRTHHLPGQCSLGGTLPIGSPPSAVPAPGFSIGLSPASPGFVIVPRERRRCVSGQSLGDPWDEVIRRVHTRRIVSDANVLPADEAERGRDEDGENDRTNPGGRTILARGRWKRLRNLILGLRSGP
jgi:hypothetical protein